VFSFGLKLFEQSLSLPMLTHNHWREMRRLPTHVRETLGAIRICRPHGTTLARALIPTDLIVYFEQLKTYNGTIRLLNIREEVVWIAERQLSIPYFNRADPEHAPEAFSCSTLTKWVFAHVGIDLPRYAIDQSYIGIPVIGVLPVGALVFFENRFPIHDPNRSIGHVGIHVCRGIIVHGSTHARKIIQEAMDAPPSICMDVIPRDPHALLELPVGMKGMETALDVARSLQRS